jgi:hypothetical protein
MERQLIETIDRAFREPETALGGGERNVEIKIVFLVLWALGWDPVKDVFLGFQIPKEKIGDRAEASHAADFVLRGDQDRVCVVGEAKEWFIDEKGKRWEEGIRQIERYTKALPVSRAFLACGKKWRIIDANLGVLDEFEPKDARVLIERLRPCIGKEQVKDKGGLYTAKNWQLGLSRGKAKAA